MVEVTESVDELMETPTFKRFNEAIDNVLDLAEDADLSELKLGKCVYTVSVFYYVAYVHIIIT